MVTEAPPQPEVIEEPSEIDEEEELARKSGWRPKDEWDKDDPRKPPKFTSAETFNARKELITEIRVQKKRVDDMELSFNERLDNQKKFQEAQAEFQKSELINKRNDSIENADKDAAIGYQDQIDKLVVPVIK